ncbi:MAG: DNA polymerase Y family protein [Brevundimonas sp.]
MPRAPSSPRRHLAVWFPFLPTDRRARRSVAPAGAPPEAGSAAPPEALVQRVGGAVRLASVTAETLALGLTPGLTLADARARSPGLRVADHTPEDDALELGRILADFGRFSPMVALDPPHGLALDVTGCAHLFGGEAGLVAAVTARAAHWRLATRTALARTPETARALARFGPGGIVAPGGDAAAGAGLPTAALELDPRDLQALRRAGLRTVGDVDRRPHAALAARFGASLPDRLDRLTGRIDVRITPHRPPPPVRADRVLAEPITGEDQVLAVLADLLGEATGALEARGEGARRLVLTLYRVDGQARALAVTTARPGRDPGALLRLFRERLAALAVPLEAGFGFEQLSLAAEATAPLAPTQTETRTGLEPPGADPAALAALVDRLSARLGPGAVLRLEPVASHLPERAVRLRPALVTGGGPAADLAPDDDDAPDDAPGDPPGRPLQLFDPPQPVEATALAPDSPPAAFRWRRVTHRVVRAEGPERIAAEWWRTPRARPRDYYRVEDEEGRRFWLFRAGAYGETPPPRWYVHGLFA